MTSHRPAAIHLVSLTMTALYINRMIDAGLSMTVDEVHDEADKGALLTRLDQLAQDAGLRGPLSAAFFPDEMPVVAEALESTANTVLSGKLGVVNQANGLLFVNAMINDVIQGGFDMITVR